MYCMLAAVLSQRVQRLSECDAMPSGTRVTSIPISPLSTSSEWRMYLAGLYFVASNKYRSCSNRALRWMDQDGVYLRTGEAG